MTAFNELQTAPFNQNLSLTALSENVANIGEKQEIALP